MTDETMTNEENFHLDAFGFLIVRNVLSAEELTRFDKALDSLDPAAVPAADAHRFPFLQLRDHPLLGRYVTEICGEDCGPDGVPRLIGQGRGVAEPLSGGSEWVDWSRAYRHQGVKRLCQRVQVYWALADAGPGEGGLVLIPASHNSNVETPADVLDGTDEMGLVEQPVLNAGDLLICVGNTVQGTRPWKGAGPQRLLSWTYVAAAVRPAPDNVRFGKTETRPDWTVQLPPQERAVVRNPDPAEPPIHVVTDGERSWVDEAAQVHHPSIYKLDPECGIDEKEFYHWDLCGHLVVPGVMDEAWMEEINEAIDANADRIHKGPSGAYGDSQTLKGEGHASGMSDLWNLPAPHCEPIRRMLAHPAVIHRLNWMMGSGYAATVANAFLSEPGGTGHGLHAGTFTPLAGNHYEVRNGRAYCEYVNVVWQMRDIVREDGGFCVVPGTHKGRYPTPEGVKTVDDDMGMVRHVAVKAGDVMMFLASAQTHGAFAWTGKVARRGVFFQYRSRNMPA